MKASIQRVDWYETTDKSSKGTAAGNEGEKFVTQMCALACAGTQE
jgi:hypothetical protein